MTRRAFLLFVLLLILLFIGCLVFGSVSIEPADVWAALAGADAGSTASFIVRQVRLPAAFTALLSGASLAVSGLMLQTVFRNPLADPSILGINAGASLGVAIAMLALGGTWAAGTFMLRGFLLILFAAFVGAAAIILCLLALSAIVRSSLMLLICGIMISYVTGSLISLLNYTATAEGVHSYVIWGLGNFNGVSLAHLPAFSLVLIVGLAAATLLIKPLNLLLLGDGYAQNLGLNTRLARTLCLAVCGVLTATVTAYCGPIAFIGLAVPHIARMFLGGANHRSLLPLTMLIGSTLALLCYLLSTLPRSHGLIPLNVITPLFGVPVILYVLLRARSVNE